MQELDGYISAAEAEREYGLYKAFVRINIRRGKIKGIKIGRDWLVSRQELDKIKRPG